VVIVAQRTHFDDLDVAFARAAQRSGAAVGIGSGITGVTEADRAALAGRRAECREEFRHRATVVVRRDRRAARIVAAHAENLRDPGIERRQVQVEVEDAAAVVALADVHLQRLALCRRVDH
jgi:hypothetical protein